MFAFRSLAAASQRGGCRQEVRLLDRSVAWRRAGLSTLSASPSVPASPVAGLSVRAPPPRRHHVSAAVACGLLLRHMPGSGSSLLGGPGVGGSSHSSFHHHGPSQRRRGFATGVGAGAGAEGAGHAVANSSGVAAVDAVAASLDTAQEVLTPAVEWKAGMLHDIGLCANTPVGLIQWSIEQFHVAGLPWWGAIAATTVVLRFLVLPLILSSLANNKRMQIIHPQVTEVQERLKEAKLRKDFVEGNRLAQEMKSLFDANGVNPLKSIGVVVVQAPLFLSCFLAIRKMADLPVVDWQTGGMLWFPDLTVADPLYILPVLVSAGMFAVIELGADGVQSPHSLQAKLITRGMVAVLLPVAVYMPAGVLCYWLTTNCFSLLQTYILKLDVANKLLGLPADLKVPAEKKTQGPGVIAQLKSAYNDRNERKDASTKIRAIQEDALFKPLTGSEMKALEERRAKRRAERTGKR